MKPFPKALRREDHLQEGVNPAPGVVLLACSVGDESDGLKSRVIVVRDELVLFFDFDRDSAVSIDASYDGLAYVMGDYGTVVRFNWRTPMSNAELEASIDKFENPVVENRGPLRRLRILGSDIVCAGSRGQVYRLDPNGSFVALPTLLVGGNDLTTEDLAGLSASDFTVATSDGFAVHFDGNGWSRLDLPVSSALNTICHYPGERYAIAGDNDTLLIGVGDLWQRIPLPESEYDYWGIAMEGETLYLSHMAGIVAFDGVGLKAVKIPRRARNEFAALRDGPDGVWSFCGLCVGLIVNGQWQVLS